MKGVISGGYRARVGVSLVLLDWAGLDELLLAGLRRTATDEQAITLVGANSMQAPGISERDG